MAAAVEKAYHAIRSGIAVGEYAPGAHITAADLATRIGVSRTPVREALRRLHAEGLVDFVANHGAYVTSWNRADIDEVFTLRAVLESHAAELAASRLAPPQIEALRDCAAHIEALAAERPDDFLAGITEANGRFHRIIIEAASNRRLAAMIATVIDMALVARTFAHYREEDLRRSMAHHRELIAAFAAGDGPWAASVMRSHVLAAHHALLASGSTD